MEEMLENQREALSLLRGLVGVSKTSTDCELLEDVLPNPIDSSDAFRDISEKIMADEGFKKKLVAYNLFYYISTVNCPIR